MGKINLEEEMLSENSRKSIIQEFLDELRSAWLEHSSWLTDANIAMFFGKDDNIMNGLAIEKCQITELLKSTPEDDITIEQIKNSLTVIHESVHKKFERIIHDSEGQPNLHQYLHFTKSYNALTKAIEKSKENAVFLVSSLDKLTGLLNRSALERTVSDAVAISDTISVISCDIDFFKKVNDTYGHDVGDVVLASVARQIKASIRPYDSALRIGGEEFVVILPDIDAQGVVTSAERIRKKIEATPLSLDEKQLSVTISCGCASAGDVGASFDFIQLLKESDDNLYKAKRAGRNCVVHNSTP